MKKILPIIIFSIIFSLFLSIFTPLVFAQTPTSPPPTPTVTVPPPTVAPTNPPTQQIDTPSAETRTGWVKDSEVSFVGKTASRANDFLEWTLQNYNWLCVTKTSQNSCDNTNNPLISFWVTIRNIVYALIALFVLGTAFVLIITRGQNVTIMRFIPRFVVILVLITLSFSLVQFIYQVVDIIQGFFLAIRPGDPTKALISTKDLLYVGFDYKSFIGVRKIGPDFDESAFISLLLVRLTAITYYVMTGILLVRKIILWFFIIISPIFPLLLFYKPIRNTAKIWIGEFFRWLFYAPLFAIFLHGLVVVWQKGIPLPFDFSKPGQVPGTDVIYPTATSILLGGPGQAIGMSNSVNLNDTFALYVVALLMLWVVILLPFLLLKIFLDYIATLSFDNNLWFAKIKSAGTPFFSGSRGPTGGGPNPPGLSQPAGMARSLPFTASRQAVQFQTSVQSSVRESRDIMRIANLSIPRMRDIASYEASLMSADQGRRAQVASLHSTLTKIANPTSVTSSLEREKFTTVRQKLLEQKEKGNPIASSVLAASQVSGQAGGALSEIKKRAEAKVAALPNVNRVQQVSLEDYEEVRKLWTENYQTIEPPRDLSGHEVNRQQWIKNDIDKITSAVMLLNSIEPDKVSQGMDMVGNILPFLLIGGFSKSEVVAYLKAKMEAGKQVMVDLSKREEEEESKLSVSGVKQEEAKTLKAEVETPGQASEPRAASAESSSEPKENPVIKASDDNKEL